MPWVKFHDELRKGAKRGFSRAVRFVFLELCLEVRAGRGTLALPIGMTDVDALQDILGGNAKEVREAVRHLSAGPEPMILLEGPAGARRLVIPSWQRWNAAIAEPSGASTQRSLRHRATLTQRPLQRDATAVAETGNARSSGDQRREEEIRSPGAGDLVRAGAPAAAPGLSVESIRAELQRFPRTAQLAADDAFVAVLLSRAMHRGAKLEWLVEALSEAAAGISGAESPSELRDRVRKFLDNARAPKAARGGPVQPISSGWAPKRVDDPANPLPKAKPGESAL